VDVTAHLGAEQETGHSRLDRYTHKTDTMLQYFSGIITRSPRHWIRCL